MANSLVAFRLPAELLSRIDVVAELLSKKARGVHVSRTQAVRVALERGLAVLEDELKHPTPVPPVRPKK